MNEEYNASKSIYGFELVDKIGRFEIRRTPGGRMGPRYSVYDSELDMTVKKGLNSLSEAEDYIEREERGVGEEAIDILGDYVGKSGPSKSLRNILDRRYRELNLKKSEIASKFDPEKFEARRLTMNEALGLVEELEKGKRKFRDIGEVAYGGWSYLGGGPRYGVWRSPAGRYQLANRIDERSYLTGLTKEKLENIAASRPHERIEFQIPMENIPKAERSGQRLGETHSFRELPSGEIIGLPAGLRVIREY